ncbi:hypothetical protein BH11PSE3_BH11PSE3_37870 [soil metagenome]
MTAPTAQPTSVHLARLLDRVDGPRVSLGFLMEQLGGRSFGFTLLVMGVLCLPPGLSYIVGLLIAWAGVQMILGYRTASLPPIIARQQVGTVALARVIALVVPRLAWFEPMIRPRWPILFEAAERVTGIVMLLLGLSLVSPVPFSQILPACTVMLLALAYLERDGLALVAGFGLAAVSLAVTAATLWGAVRTMDWLNPAALLPS